MPLSATPSTVLGTLKDFLSPPEPPFSVPSASSSQQPPGKPLPSPSGKHPKAQPKHHPQTDFLLFQVKPGERSWLLLVVICKVYLTPPKQAIFMQNLLVHKSFRSSHLTTLPPKPRNKVTPECTKTNEPSNSNTEKWFLPFHTIWKYLANTADLAVPVPLALQSWLWPPALGLPVWKTDTGPCAAGPGDSPRGPSQVGKSRCISVLKWAI